MFPKLQVGAGIREAIQKAQRESSLNRLFSSALGRLSDEDEEGEGESGEHGGEDGDDSDGDVTGTDTDAKPKWKPPTEKTIQVLSDIFGNLIDRQKSELKLMMVETALTLCPPDEDILQVEDKDHYNLLQKATIFNSLSMVNLLLSHGCNINNSSVVGRDKGARPNSCQISKKCPHVDVGNLHLACYLGRTDIVDLLLRRGADKSANKRVYTSAVIDCPPTFQLDVLSTCVSQEATDLVSKCGCRPPVFFAVIGDHVEIVKMLLGVGDVRGGSEKVDPGFSHLVHLACRVGSYRCLCYLVDLYPHAILSPDADGLLPLVMGMKHGLRFVDLLIQRGADIHALNNLWHTNTNILHLLYKALPFPDMDLVTLTHVSRVCLEQRVRVNAQQQPFLTTPLHELLCAVNIPSNIELLHPERNGHNAEEKLCRFDKDIVSTVISLLMYGADVTLTDGHGKAPLQVLLTNGNHTVRLNAALKYQTPTHVSRALASNSYGLENTLKIARLLLDHGAPVQPLQPLGTTPLKDLIELVCSSYYASGFGSDYWAWTHSLEILNFHEILEGYCQIIRLLLQRGCNPNAYPEEGTPPMLYLLTHITYSPNADDYVIPLATARAVSTMVSLFLSYGARTDCEIETRRSVPRVTGCFDTLMAVLETMQDYPHSRSAKDLGVLQILALPLIQHGARTVVYRKLLYGDPGAIADVPWCYCIPTHSFLYQYLEFGALNLHFVKDGTYFKDLLDVLCNQADHYTLQDVLSTVHVQFVAIHEPGRCPCGDCGLFYNILRPYLHKPRSLKQISRLVVLNSLHGIRPAAVEQLCLPTSLRAYLLSFQT